MKKKPLIFFIFILLLLSFEEPKSNDFPTYARSEFVFACMSSNKNDRDFMSNKMSLMSSKL